MGKLMRIDLKEVQGDTKELIRQELLRERDRSWRQHASIQSLKLKMSNKDKRIAELEEQLAASGEALSRIIEMHKEIVLDNLTLKIELAQAGGVNARMREELLKYYRRHIRGWPTRPHHITYYKNRIAELEGE
jgi:hypothetical protein